MEYTICVGIESTQQPYKQYSIAKTPFFQRFEMEYKIFVSIESTQQSHKHDIQLQNTNFFSVLQ